MQIATPAADLTTIRELLEDLLNEAGIRREFIGTTLGGDWAAMVARDKDGTWCLNEDYILTYYTGDDFLEDDVDPKFELTIDPELELAEIAQAVRDAMVEHIRDSAARQSGRAAGENDARIDSTTPHYRVVENAAAAARFAAPLARAAFGHGYIDGWYGVYTAKAV